MQSVKSGPRKATPTHRPQAGLIVDQQPNPAYDTANTAVMVRLGVEPYHYVVMHAHNYTDCGIGDTLDQSTLNQLIAEGVDVEIT